MYVRSPLTVISPVISVGEVITRSFPLTVQVTPDAWKPNEDKLQALLVLVKVTV